MYILQQQIGEELINVALRKFLEDWKGGQLRNGQRQYATSVDLLCYLKEVCPSEQQYLLSALFEEVNIVDIETIGKDK